MHSHIDLEGILHLKWMDILRCQSVGDVRTHSRLWREDRPVSSASSVPQTAGILISSLSASCWRMSYTVRFHSCVDDEEEIELEDVRRRSDAAKGEGAAGTPVAVGAASS
jgi:hypothetical protein